MELAAENERLRPENAALADLVARLKEELSRDSGNSSWSPSSDPQAIRQSRADSRAAARAATKHSGMSQGQQPGVPGARFECREPKKVVAHPPLYCEACGADLAGATVSDEVRRQVIGIPEVRVKVIDHVAERRRCTCGHETVGVFPPRPGTPMLGAGSESRRRLVAHGPPAPALAAHRRVCGRTLDAPVSTGWLCALQAEAADELAWVHHHAEGADLNLLRLDGDPNRSAPLRWWVGSSEVPGRSATPMWHGWR